MQSDDLMAWFVVAPLGVATLWRLPAAIRTPKSRSLWWIYSSLAVSMATRLTWIGNPINRTAEQLIGLEEASTLAKHLSGIFAVAMLLRWVVAVVPGREDGYPDPTYRRLISNRPRRAATWLAVLIITAIFPLANLRPDTSIEDSDFIFLQGGHIWGSLHLILFYAYVVFGMVCASLMCSDAHHEGGNSTLGRGLMMMSTGCALGACYGLIRIAYLLIRLARRQFIGGPEFVAVSSNLCLILCVALLCCGSLAPTIERINHALDTHAAINDLRPMWQTITRYTPERVLDKEDDRLRAFSVHVKKRHPWLAWRLGALVDFWNWRDLDQRLRRRVTEIFDAAHILQDYVADDLYEEAEMTVKALKLPRQAGQAYILYRAISAVARQEEIACSERAKPLLNSLSDVPLDAKALLPIGTMLHNRTAMRKLDRRLAR